MNLTWKTLASRTEVYKSLKCALGHGSTIACMDAQVHSLCFHKNIETHMCTLMTPKWQGNAIVFPALITIVLGNAYVLNGFFWSFLKTETRSCFSRSSSPESLFLPETLHISRSKGSGNDMQREKRNLPESHDKLPNKCKI